MLSESNAMLVWGIATTGNTLGSLVNWFLGHYLTRFSDRAWFPFKPEALTKAQARFKRYGAWSLLFAWVPIGGDAITFVAGVMKVPAALFLLLVAIGKGTRYAAVIMVYYGINIALW
jgi:membrane protein YqaA with SNARE-associated domain